MGLLFVGGKGERKVLEQTVLNIQQFLNAFWIRNFLENLMKATDSPPRNKQKHQSPAYGNV